MTRYVVVFPGYGSQYVGMGRELVQNFRLASEVFDEASEILGYSLTQLCFDGPTSVLDDIANAQAAILTVSVAAWRVIADVIATDVTPAGLCGHSLGEISSLVAAGSIQFADALEFIHERGMAAKSLDLPRGGMLALMARDFADLEETMQQVCKQVGGVLERASENCATQVILAGTLPALTRIGEIYEARGALCTSLNAGFPLHTSTMEPLVSHLRPLLVELAITNPILPVMGSLKAEWLCTIGQVREEILGQLSHRVRWAESVKRLLMDTNAQYVVELGPSRVLTSLMDCIDRSVGSARFGGEPKDLKRVTALATRDSFSFRSMCLDA